MRKIKFGLAIFAGALLASCGGGGGGDQSTKIKFSSQVSFGDSLSDVGTYAVGTVAALGGGKYTINDVNSTGVNAAKNWTELIAAQLGLPAPCPAQTGLDGSAAQGFSVPVVNRPGCTAYGQGGARVTNPIGPGNKALGGANAVLGQLTVPVVTQIRNHLAANGGKFKGDEIVFLLAGGNDVLINLATLSAGATAAATAAVTAAVPAQIGRDIASGTCVPTDAQASNCVTAAAATLRVTVGTPAANAYVQANAPTVVAALGTAGAELAYYVNTLILGNGARYVTVVNLPDVSITPLAKALDASTQALINTMVTTFNANLVAGLNNNPNVLYVDAYSVSRDQSLNPGPYGLTNVTTPACDLTPAKNILGVALACNRGNLIAGANDNYQFADTVHPTPFGYFLLARYVALQLVTRGWL